MVETALEGISRIGSQRPVEYISDLLGSSNTELRIAALRAIRWLTDDHQRPLLERALQDPSARVRRRALSYLSQHDSYWAVEEALRLCDDQEPVVQWAAVEALMTLRPSQACDHLERIMPSLDAAYQRRAAILLKQRKDQGAISEKTPVKRQIRPLKAAPQRQDANSKPAAGARRKEAASPCDPEAAELVPTCSLDMKALLKEHSPRDRVKATTLRTALDDLLHGSDAARRCALENLVGLGQIAESPLVACLQEDSLKVVELALEGLGRIGSPRVIGGISDVLGSSNVEQRIVALRATRRLTDDQQQPLLGRGLRDPSARVRRRALSYLSWHDSYWAIAEAMRLCDDQQPDVQWAALEALMALKPAEAYVSLELMMPSLDPVYQHRAAILLKKREDEEALAEMTEEEEFEQPSDDVKTRIPALFRRFVSGRKPAPIDSVHG